MNHQTITANVWLGAQNAWTIQGDTSATAYQVMMPFSPTTSHQSQPSWIQNKELRHEYMVASVEQDIAWQIRINREKRGLTQRQLAEMIGSRQSAIARAEDPEYGKHSVATLIKIAKVFECGLLLKLVSYDKFFEETKDVSEDGLSVPA